MSKQQLFRKLSENEVQLQKTDDMEYLVLLHYNDGIQSFEKKEGRMNTYEFLKSIVEGIDVYESKILSSKVTLKDMISVYDFVERIATLIGDSFDISEYAIGDDM